MLRLTSVSLAASGGDERRVDVVANGWPVPFTLFPQANLRVGKIQVSGYAGDKLAVRRSAEVRFTDGEQTVRLILTQACAEVFETCEAEGETCAECGRCAPVVALGMTSAVCSSAESASGSARSDGSLTGQEPAQDAGLASDAGSEPSTEVTDAATQKGNAQEQGLPEGGPDPIDVTPKGDAGPGDATPATCPNEPKDLVGRGIAFTVGDFDGDRKPDLAVARRDYVTEVTRIDSAGMVEVYLGSTFDGKQFNGPPFIWSQGHDDTSAAPEIGDLCGTALAAGDFNNDKISDLAVGCPGEALANNSVPNAGMVFVVFGDRDVANRMLRTGQLFDHGHLGNATKLETDDRFGSALATGDFDADGIDDLAVGTPGESAANADGLSRFGAGVVNIIRGVAKTTTSAGGVNQANPFGLAQVTVAANKVGLVPGSDDTYENDDAFGTALLTTKVVYRGVSRTALVVSAPGEDDGRGLVSVFITDPTTGLEPPLAHIALRADVLPSGHLGAALAVDGEHRIFASAPDEGGGRVLLFDGSSGWEAPSVTSLWQGPDALSREPFDRFGAALAVAAGRLIVGVPGEDVNLTCNGGQVESYPLPTLNPAGRVVYDLPAGGAMGYALTAYGAESFGYGAPGANAFGVRAP